MAKFSFFRGDEVPFVDIAALTSDEDRAALGVDEVSGAVRVRHEGGDDDLHVFELRYPPDARVPPHAHLCDEIVVVLQGEVIFGSRSYGAGASVLIPACTLYSFRAGARGVTLLNLRAKRDQSILSPADLVARKRRGESTRAVTASKNTC